MYKRQDHLSRKDVAVLFALLSGLCLLRNNGLYVSLAVLAYLLAVFPAFRKGVFFVLVALVAGVFVLQGPVFHALSIETVSYTHLARGGGRGALPRAAAV